MARKKKNKEDKRIQLMKEFLIYCRDMKFVPKTSYVSSTQLATNVSDKACETIRKIKKHNDRVRDKKEN